MYAFTERAAGERLFVDYAGHTIDVIDPMTGEVRTAQLFVAALGASSYTFAEATWTQSLPDWVASHVRAFGFLGGVTEYSTALAHLFHGHVASHSMTCGHPREVICEAIYS